MEKHDEELITRLLPAEPDLQGLYDEHRHLERQLKTLQHKPHLSVAEDLEKKRLQKLKLAGKDRMMAILARHRGQ